MLAGNKFGIFALKATTHRAAVYFYKHRAFLVYHVFAVHRAVLDADRVSYLAGVSEKSRMPHSELGDISEIVIRVRAVAEFVLVVLADRHHPVLSFARDSVDHVLSTDYLLLYKHPLIGYVVCCHLSKMFAHRLKHLLFVSAQVNARRASAS